MEEDVCTVNVFISFSSARKNNCAYSTGIKVFRFTIGNVFLDF